MLVPRLVVFTHALGVLGLALSVAYALSLRCEGFGCVGIGVVWVSWSVLFVVWLLFGLVSRSQSRKGSAGLASLSALSVRAQWLLGALVVIRWLL